MLLSVWVLNYTAKRFPWEILIPAGVLLLEAGLIATGGLAEMNRAACG